VKSVLPFFAGLYISYRKSDEDERIDIVAAKTKI